jgi:hypothetical protein
MAGRAGPGAGVAMGRRSCHDQHGRDGRRTGGRTTCEDSGNGMNPQRPAQLAQAAPERGQQGDGRYRQDAKLPVVPPRGTQRDPDRRTLLTRFERVGDADGEVTVSAPRYGAEPGGQSAMLDADHEASAPRPATCQTADHHSRGSPGPPITAMTSVPATSSRTGA